MPELTSVSVQTAIEHGQIWDLGNEVLYKLCADFPDHKTDSVIIAKTWLIGRAYAAALERRRIIGDFRGDAFYESHVTLKIREFGIDAWFELLRCEGRQNGRLAVEVHKKFTDLLFDITKLKKRSFASKYLHFHFPEKFFIYNSRADKSARELTKKLGLKKLGLEKKSRKNDPDIDAQYANFVTRCELLRKRFFDLTGKTLTPREVDKIFLYENSK